MKSRRQQKSERREVRQDRNLLNCRKPEDAMNRLREVSNRFAALLRCALLAGLALTVVACRDPGPAEAVSQDGNARMLGVMAPKQLKETSGLSVSRVNPDLVWVHNDGDKARVFGLSRDGTLVQDIELTVRVTDTEDIALGPGPAEQTSFVYLGDIGDNQADRSQISVVGFPEPTGGAGQDELSAQQFVLQYPDGAHDAEALMVDPVQKLLVIVTKEKGRSRVYSAPLHQLSPDSPATLQLLATLDVDKVSAGDISADGSVVILRREEMGWMWRREAGESLATMFSRQPQNVPVLGQRQADNGEAIGIEPDATGYLTVSEGKQEAIYRFGL
jgi:hypothetical protein